MSLRTSHGTLTALQILEIQAIESSSNLQIVKIDDRKVCVPTAEFLKKIQAFLLSAWDRIVTPTVAYQTWMLSRDRIMELRSQYKRAADVAHWLHVNPFDLSSEQLVGMAANIPRVQAQQQLANGQFGVSDYEYIYNLTLLATDDEQQALNARSDAMRAYMDQQCKRSASQ